MAVKLVLAGHSHIHAMGVPGHVPGGPPGIVPIKHPTADLAAVVGKRDDPYWDALVEASRDRQAAIIWTGNQHYANFTFIQGHPFDFIPADAPELAIDRKAQIVPEAMIRATFEPGMERLRVLLGRIRAVSPNPPIVIGTPPVKGDPERFCRNLDASLALKAAAGRLGVTITAASLTSVPVMNKLWRLLQSMLAESAVATGAQFVPVPAHLITAAGVLADDHWHDDATHTNRRYGTAMLAEVIRRAAAHESIAA